MRTIRLAVLGVLALAAIAHAQPTPGPPGLPQVNHDSSMSGTGKTTSVLAIALMSGSGLTTGSGTTALSLLRSCANGNTLIWTSGTSSWGCGSAGGGSGTVTSITAGNGIAASPSSPITTAGTLSVNNGTGLIFASGALTYDATVIQTRVSGTCTAPNSITAVNSNGTVSCTTGVVNGVVSTARLTQTGSQLDLASVLAAGSCTNCSITWDIYGRITVGGSGSGGGITASGTPTANKVAVFKSASSVGNGLASDDGTVFRIDNAGTSGAYFNVTADALNFGYSDSGNTTTYINQAGYQNAYTAQRSTVIGDGQGSPIATFTASSHSVSIVGNAQLGGNFTVTTYGTFGTTVYAGGGSYGGVLLHGGANSVDFAANTNAAATGFINSTGYAEGTTQFRSLEIDNGKGTGSGFRIATFDATTLSVTIYGSGTALSLPSGNISVGNNATVAGSTTTNTLTVNSTSTYAGLARFGSGTDTSGVGSNPVMVTNAGATDLAVRDSTNDVEIAILVNSSGGFVGTFTNHGLSIQTNNTTAISITNAQAVTVLQTFAVNGNTTLGDAQTDITTIWGNTVAAGTTPTTAANCNGTGTASVVGTNMAGTVTLGATGSITACTVNWVTTRPHAPACVIEHGGTKGTYDAHFISAQSAAATTFQFETDWHGEYFNYQCAWY